jgi:hypothetical protein
MAFKRFKQLGLHVRCPNRRAFGSHGHDSSMTDALSSGSDEYGVIG